MIVRTIGYCALSIAWTLAALPAAAGGASDVGGSWDLTISCKGTAAGVPSKRKETLFLPIQEAAGGDLQAGAGDTGGLVGYVLYDSAKPERARIALASCNLSTQLAGVLIQAAGKISGEDGRLKGTAIFLDSAGEAIEQCKAKLVRTNAQGAPVLLCL